MGIAPSTSHQIDSTIFNKVGRICGKVSTFCNYQDESDFTKSIFTESNIQSGIIVPLFAMSRKYNGSDVYTAVADMHKAGKILDKYIRNLPSSAQVKRAPHTYIFGKRTGYHVVVEVTDDTTVIAVIPDGCEPFDRLFELTFHRHVDIRDLNAPAVYMTLQDALFHSLGVSPSDVTGMFDTL